MTRSVETDAFVLRAVDYGDNHVIVTMLGRELGKFSAIARSAKKSKKRFAGGLLPLRALRATVTFKPQRDLAELSDSAVQRDYPGLDLSYDKITIASYCTELVRAVLRDHDEARAMFDLLEGVYERLASCDDTSPVLRVMLHHFELQLLGLVGHAPSLDQCHRCGVSPDAMDKIRCGRDGHGIVCADCVRPGERYGVLSADAMHVLGYLTAPHGRPPEAIADDEVSGQVRRVLDASLEHVIDSELRSRALLDGIFGAAR